MSLSIDKTIFYNNGRHILDRSYPELIDCMIHQIVAWSNNGHTLPRQMFTTALLHSIPIPYPPSNGMTGIEYTRTLVQTIKDEKQRLRSGDCIFTDHRLESTIDINDRNQNHDLDTPTLISIIYTPRPTYKTFTNANQTLFMSPWTDLLQIEDNRDQTFGYTDSKCIKNVLEYSGMTTTEHTNDFSEHIKMIEKFGGNIVGSDDYAMVHELGILGISSNKSLLVTDILNEMTTTDCDIYDAIRPYLHPDKDALVVILNATAPDYTKTMTINQYYGGEEDYYYPTLELVICETMATMYGNESCPNLAKLCDAVDIHNRTLINNLYSEIL